MTATHRLTALLLAAAIVVPRLALADAPGTATRCTAALVPFSSTRGVARPVAELAERNLRAKLALRGCELAPDRAVAGMKAMLHFPRRPASADWIRLGKALLADLVVTGSLTQVGTEVRVELVICRPASGESWNRSSTVPPADLLATVLRLFEEMVPAPAASPPASAPASRPLAPPPVAATRPAAPPPPLRPPPPPVVAPAPPVPPPPALPVATKRAAAQGGQHLMMAAGLRLFSFFSPERAGPALDLELGGIAENWHWGIFFRPSFGEVNGYAVGGRAEGGPHIGPIRLCIGAGMSLTFIPDTDEDIDLLTFSVELVGAVYQWKHLVVQLEAFTLDLNLTPASAAGDIDLIWGFSSGLSVGVRF